MGGFSDFKLIYGFESSANGQFEFEFILRLQ